jgi:hypothetical protein
MAHRVVLMDARWCAEPTDPVYYVMAALTVACATVVAHSCVLLVCWWAVASLALLPTRKSAKI